jgi:anti-sigma regulatory factor (Ser/Thr protein kinase)
MNLSLATLERLKSAVAEATLNAIEHKHHYQSDLPIFIRVLVLEQAISVDGFNQDNKLTLNAQTPELSSRALGQPARRGWGFFLIHKLGEELTDPGEAYYTLELFLYQEED